MPTDYRAIARQKAKQYGIPEGIFLSLVSHESGFRPDARSPAGAIGLAQLMPGTAAGLGVDPSNPVQNLDGGARYLAAQYKRFKTWRGALAAYNAGPGAVESGKWLSYGETTSYVKNVLADAGNYKPSTATVQAVDPTAGVPVPAAGMPALPDLSQQALAGLQTAGHHTFDPVAGLSDLTMGVAAAQSRANVGNLPPEQMTARNGRATKLAPDYSSMSLGKIIGTPGAGTHTVGNWQSDNAWDIAVPVGTPIRADADGVIGNRIGYLGAKGDKGRFAGMRVNLVGGDNAYYYAHLSRLAVKAGQRVKKGQIIGYSGEANGVAHLHLGIQHI